MEAVVGVEVEAVVEGGLQRDEEVAGEEEVLVLAGEVAGEDVEGAEAEGGSKNIHRYIY